VRLDLDRHRSIGELIGLTFEVFWRHLATFLSLTLLLVAPIVIGVDGVWDGTLADGGKTDHAGVATQVSGVLTYLVIPPLATALNIAAVQAIARGEEPTVGAAIRTAWPRLLPVFGAVMLYVVLVCAGVILLVIPGIWLAVTCYFASQAAVIDRLGPRAALVRSAEIVKGRWWRTFGAILLFGLITAVPSAIVGAVLGSIDEGVIYTSVLVLVQAVLFSLGAIFSTLLFFDSRARRSLPWQGTPSIDPIAHEPERPIQPPRI
jgi:hypothetical protein